LSGFLRETLGERENIAFGKIKFHPLHAMHRKKTTPEVNGSPFLIW